MSLAHRGMAGGCNVREDPFLTSLLFTLEFQVQLCISIVSALSFIL